ncbi:MAG: hypothetical protein IPK59_03045 [Rhodospirillaceae bacterium]|nr:hypothetical protein [Rhodospirillaceae bacterium]
MGKWGEGIGRAIAPITIRFWRSLDNPAWNYAAIAEEALAAALSVTVNPSRVRRKLVAKSVVPIKDSFLVDGLGAMPSEPIEDLYTFMDMSDIARFGEDFAGNQALSVAESKLARRPAGRGTRPGL